MIVQYGQARPATSIEGASTSIAPSRTHSRLRCALSLDLTETGRTRSTIRWQPKLNAFPITFGDRWPTAEAY